MAEMIIILIVSYIIFILYTIIKFSLSGKKTGCISSILPLIIILFISISITRKLNPYKADSLFFQEELTKKIDEYKSIYRYKNKDSLQQISFNNYIKNSDKTNIKEVVIGSVCNDGTIVPYIQKGACSYNGGFNQYIFLEIEKYSPPIIEFKNNYSAPKVSNSRGSVHVRGYYRADGTYVRPHTRSYPDR